MAAKLLPTYDETTKSSRTFQSNKTAPVPESNTVSATGDANGAFIDLLGYDGCTVQVELGTSGTYTVALTEQADNATALTACTYRDVSQYGVECMTAAQAATYSADGVFKIAGRHRGLRVSFSAISGAATVYTIKGLTG